MEITSIILQTSNLMQMKKFYINKFGFSLISETTDSFRIAVGSGELEFTTKGVKEHPYYHFAFNIPANKFYEAKSWVKERVNLFVEEGEDEVYFTHLPARALYFYDPSGNIVELISRYEIADDSMEPFSTESIINISEIGLIVEDPISAGKILNQIDLTERDHKSISATSLNFMGERGKGIFVILARPGRRWFFSDKTSEIFPLEITLRDNCKIIVNSNSELHAYRAESNIEFL